MPGFVNRTPSVLKERGDWRQRRRCIKNPDRWFIKDPGSFASTEEIPLSLDNLEALGICRRECPVANLCLVEAYLSHADGVIQGAEVMWKGKQCS